MTDRYAIIGNPVAHTKSPRLQTAFAAQCGQDIAYETILGALDGFVEAVRRFQHSGGKGMNITVPFKIEAFRLADELTPRARAAGAVNMFSFREDGSILGDNTDGCGIVTDITVNLGCALTDRRVLLLGAGGAARGALLPLLAKKPAYLYVANRTQEKAVQLAAEFTQFAGSTRIEGGSFASANGPFDIVINGTSSSLSDDMPPLADGVLSGALLAYDMFYSAEPTRFMRTASAAGAKQVADGLGMVVEQGAECFFLWRGLRPETASVITALRAS